MNAADLWKFTPLHEAAAKGKFDICKLLLKVIIFNSFQLIACCCAVSFSIKASLSEIKACSVVIFLHKVLSSK